MSTSAIILAAGKSTRMKSARPKPIHEICGRPMLQWVLDACYGAGVDHVYVVIGHGRDEIMSAFGHDKRITWVEQTEQLGTGHAARMVVPHLEKHPGGDVFILAGDGPLIRSQVLQTLQRAHHDERAAASMATAVLDDPTGYGRIIRDDAGDFIEIVEQADGTHEQLAIREVFPSYYCLKTSELLFALPRLKNENRKREYYLTDVFAVLKQAGRKIAAIQAVTAEDVLAVNTRVEQAEVDAIMQDRVQRELRQAGVTIVSAHATYIEAGASIGADTTVHPFSFVGRGASIGRECVIGPFAVIPRDAVVPDGTTVAGNVSPETARLVGGGA